MRQNEKRSLFLGRGRKDVCLGGMERKTGREPKNRGSAKYSPHPSKFGDNPLLAMELGKKVSKNMGKMGKGKSSGTGNRYDLIRSLPAFEPE